MAIGEAEATRSRRLARGRDLLLRDAAGAAAAARELLVENPGDPAARLLLGAALRRCGDVQGALSVLLPLSDDEPGAWGAQFEAGVALAILGERDAAIGRLSRASKLNPAFWLIRAVLQDQQDDADEEAPAETDLRGVAAAQLAGDPSAPVRLRQMGLALNDVITVKLLADAGLRLGYDAEVIRLVAPQLGAAPGFGPLRRVYAQALLRQQRGADALAVLVEEPEARRTSGGRALQAAALIQIGRYPAAGEIYEQLLRAQPRRARLWLSYGHVLKILGRRDEAVAAYRRALACSPRLGEAYWSIANLKLERFTLGEVRAMERLLEDPDLPSEERINVQFALGKAYEDANQFSEAFAAYAAGAALARRGRPFDPEAQRAFVGRSRQALTGELFEARAAAGCRAPDPIFIVGLPRSGSTLVEQILASHSKVEGAAELPDLPRLAAELAAAMGAPETYPEGIADLPLPALRGLGEAYLARTRVYRSLDRPHFTDKFPGNFLHTGLIGLALPNAKIIDVRRDPMACCVSAFKQHFARGQNYSYDLGWLGEYYRAYTDLMSHYDEAMPGRILRVEYERLVIDPESEVRRILAHCGLEFEADCLEFHRSKRPVRTASSEQVRRPITADAVAHWRNYEPWLEPLKAALRPKS